MQISFYTENSKEYKQLLTLSWQRSLSYRNQSIDLLCKSVDWFLYNNGFRHERVNSLTRSRFGLSHLNKRKFRHNFQDYMNPLCSFSLEIENWSDYLLHCHNFHHQRIDLMSSVKSICDNLRVWCAFIQWLWFWWKQT